MFKTLETFDTEFSADSVEWCPIAEFRDHFVCGTYQLLSNDQKKRVGRIYLLQVIPAGKLHLLHQVDVPAVLDMKWAHVVCQDQILLGVVNAIGYLQVWKLEREGKMKLLVETKLYGIENHECLALSLDWNTGRCSNSSINEAKITISDSKGFITIYSISQGKLSLVGSQMAHQFEAWITAFNYWNTNIIYSGGDDCKFRWFDLRSSLEPVGSNAVHTAGVTSLHSNAGHEFSLASGSYDETLRLWDTRHIRKPVSEITLSGGIWRLKWDPFHYKNILAACMYGHFKIINCNYNNNLNIVGEFEEHESIAYGCDWSSLCENELINKLLLQKYQCTPALTATCSFYDHVLKLATVELFD